MLLEVTFGKLYAWAVQNIRNILMDANAKFKELGELTSWLTGCIKIAAAGTSVITLALFRRLALHCVLWKPADAHVCSWKDFNNFLH